MHPFVVNRGMFFLQTMQSYQATITNTKGIHSDLLIAQLFDAGFDGVEEQDNKLIAYSTQLSLEAIKAILNEVNVDYQLAILEEQNWNAVWESNFQPLIIPSIKNNQPLIGIRADFHQPFKLPLTELIITPKMSFGTGHHPTTFLVLQLMELINFNGKLVYDFGTGTGVLAIYAEKLGAAKVLAVDNDNWCVENTKENVAQNNCHFIEVGKVLNANQQQIFDIVIANVNRNIIIDNIEYLQNAMKADGQLLLSGLLDADENELKHILNSYNINIIKSIYKDGWMACIAEKQA
ncbi:MAG: 50S ribosomal protein L11 methyltransferase [Chitinophagaceae bacterium]